MKVLLMDLGAGIDYTAATIYDRMTERVMAESYYAGIERTAAPPIPQLAQDEPQTRKAQQRRYREHIERKLSNGRRWPVAR